MKRFLEWLTLENIDELTPMQMIGKGHFAKVYSTQDPNTVMRIEKHGSQDGVCEKIMKSPEMQNTGGVAKIKGVATKQIDGELYDVTYKEKVDTNWSKRLGAIHKEKIESIYPNIDEILKQMHMGSETAESIGNVPAFIELVLEKFRSPETIIQFLKIFPEADGIIRAIDKGLPYDDLHSDNLGINSKGNLVVIDC